jgi:hypothetical protein
MKIIPLRELCCSVRGQKRSTEPILLTHCGRPAGIFFPVLQFERKREMFTLLSSEIARQIRRRGLNEKQILIDFESRRKGRRKVGLQ